jgi:hypothetical protein
MEGKILETLAAEALKPVSSFIDAALGPKLKRIRTNAKKRELKNRLEDKVVNELLEQYFKRLLRHVSGITTIVFPHEPISLIKIYEPAKLKKTAAANFKKNDDETLSLAANDLKAGESYLIVDSAGMGKSTFAKYLVLDIFQSTTKIPLFLELRRIDNSESLVGKLAKEIDEHQDDIDERFLGMLLEQGEYVIVLDGYDELSEDAKKRIGQQITELALKYEKNTIILTSRPEVFLPEVANATLFSMQPLDRKQAESLVLRYDKAAGIDVGKGLITQFDTVSPEFLKTPLLVVLLYRTYGYNRSIATKVISFYDDIYNAFYKGHDLHSKAGFSRQKLSGLDFEEFRRLLRGFAFLLATQQKSNITSETEAYSIIEDSMKLTAIKPASAAAFFDDLLLAVPLLIKESNEFRFIHKSVGDFFTAEFLAFSPDAEEILAKLRTSSITRSFFRPFEFLADLNPSLFKRTLVAPLARQLINEKDPIEDPILRTVWFVGNLAIGIKVRDKFPSFFNSFDFMSIHGVDFLERFLNSLLDLSPNMRLKFERVGKPIAIPWAAWKLVSKEFTLNIKLEDAKLEIMNVLKEILKPETMYPLNSEVFIKHSNDRALRSLFAAMLIFALPRGDRPQLRVIDLEACQKVLDEIRQERETQSWLNNLIDK